MSGFARPLRIVAVLAALGSTAAHAVLFTNDAETRREATAEEKKMIVNFRNTVFFIAPTIAVTANHTATDGALMYDAERVVYVTKVLDRSASSHGGLDYKVLEVSWGIIDEAKKAINPAEPPKDLVLLNELAPGETEPMAEVSGSENVVFHQEAIKALGFPKDRRKATTSAGDVYYHLPLRPEERPTPTSPASRLIFFNAGVVSGNSGGPILDANGKLLGIVVGGPDNSYAPTFDPRDPRQFNYGVSAHALYTYSKPFRDAIDQAAAIRKNAPGVKP